MWKFLSRKSRRAIVLGATAALLTGVGFACGLMFGGFGKSDLHLPEELLYASATDSTDKFVVATGPVEAGLEGVFFLDPLSGDLQCTVFNPRAGIFNALFRRNVLVDLKVDKEKRPRFLMVTGLVSSKRQVGLIQSTGGCIAYVVEANSGKYAAYAVPWRSDLASRGQPQANELMLLTAGNVRTAAIRE